MAHKKTLPKWKGFFHIGNKLNCLGNLIFFDLSVEGGEANS